MQICIKKANHIVNHQISPRNPNHLTFDLSSWGFNQAEILAPSHFATRLPRNERSTCIAKAARRMSGRAENVAQQSHNLPCVWCHRLLAFLLSLLLLQSEKHSVIQVLLLGNSGYHHRDPEPRLHDRVEPRPVITVRSKEKQNVGFEDGQGGMMLDTGGPHSPSVTSK